MRFYKYNREKAVEYATSWALLRNPRYYDFSSIGGDCTNFCSQALFFGAPVMNYKKTLGWYYNSVSDRAPAWTGVNEFYNFLTKNDGLGPLAKTAKFSELEIGDFIQIERDNHYTHSLIVTKIINGVPLVSSHSFDRLNAPLSAYYYEGLRFIKILGYNGN
ncbi:MAG: amidase domain-containing protein [Clostridia bacterium]|nr:amidase domain-containing protein [Clostridia bacterium]